MTKITHSHRIPWAALLALLCVGVIEGGVLLFGPEPGPPDLLKQRFYRPGIRPDPWESLVQWSVYHMQNIPEDQDVLFLGDSSCLMGLYPLVFAEWTGKRAWNLGTSVLMYADGHADLLKMYLRKHSPPELVVYHITPYMLEMSRQEVAEKGDLRKFREWVGVHSGPQLTSMRWRGRLGRKVGAYLPPHLEARRGCWPSDQEMCADILSRRGACTEPRVGDWPQREFERQRFVSQDCAPGLRRLFAMADAHNFDVLVVLHPWPDRYWRPDAVVRTADAVKFLTGLAGRFRSVHVRQPALRTYGDEQFAMLEHLTPAGAEQNTRELAEWYLATYGSGNPDRPDSKPRASDSKAPISAHMAPCPPNNGTPSQTTERPREAVSSASGMLRACKSTR